MNKKLFLILIGVLIALFLPTKKVFAFTNYRNWTIIKQIPSPPSPPTKPEPPSAPSKPEPPSPPEASVKPTPTPSPTASPQPTITPEPNQTPTPSGNGGGGEGGTGGGDVSGTSDTGAEVLGLSHTSSVPFAKPLVFWFGILALVYGLKTTGQALYARNKS